MQRSAKRWKDEYSSLALNVSCSSDANRMIVQNNISRKEILQVIEAAADKKQLTSRAVVKSFLMFAGKGKNNSTLYNSYI